MSGSIEEQALAVLNEQIRPLLHIHGGEAAVVGADEETGVVHVEMLGSCGCCALAPWTYAAVLRPRLTQIEGVEDVKVTGVNISEQALRRMTDLFAPRVESDEAEGDA